jgi:hypothetical protein
MADRFTWLRLRLSVPLEISVRILKHVQIDLEDGTRLVQVILWRKEKEWMAQHHLIDK